jgi:2-polyprenyl-3-methyl-5-hydroxy-6-metoxy-1,4-benzoquinol methylase
MTEDKFYFEKRFSRKNYKFIFDYEKDIIKNILRYKKEGKVLDLGCGEGGNSIELAKRKFDVTCIDISKTAIKQIKEESKKRKLKVKAICEDLNLFKGAEKYDVILFLGVSHFIKNPLKLIKHLMEILNKGGVFILDILKEEKIDKESILKISSEINVVCSRTHKESFGDMIFLIGIKK